MTLNSYVNKIARHLLCNSDKKKEIIKQIKSDIEIKVDGGLSPDIVFKQMGSPKDVAAEFNDNFDENEKKKIKRKKRLIIIACAVAVVVFFAVVLYWMFPKAEYIENSDIFTEAEVKTKAEYIIDALNDKEYKVIENNMTEDLKSVLNASQLEKAANDFCEDYGKFKSFGKCYMAEINQRGQKFAIAQLNVSYENISVTYTLTFDDKMKLAGFYIK